MTGSPVWMEGLQITGLAKRYGVTAVFDAVNLDLPRGRTLAVFGASGCGKTTLLRVIAGLEAADAGRIRLGGRDIGQLSPQQRQALYLYQEALLFPHLDVLENVAFGLRLRRCPERELRAICSEPVKKSSAGDRQAVVNMRSLSHEQRAFAVS